MKLLIITQVIDTKHPILGFFHRWVEEFAKHCDHVHVIALQVGVHSLPANVTVHSLGKETGAGRLQNLARFYSLIWSLRREYDAVFVHMNQVYVILGSWLWRLAGKQVGLWYAHGTVTRSLVWAEKMTQHIFTCSVDSFRIASKKVTVTGHGIDTDHFAPHNTEPDLDLVTVGRITPSKNLEQLLTSLAMIQRKYPVTLTIVGQAVTPADVAYETSLKHTLHDLQLEQRVFFRGAVPQSALPAILNRAKVFVTVAQNGSLDKAMLEPMACEIAVVSMAPGSRSLPLKSAQVDSLEAFVEAVQEVLESKRYRVPAYRSYIEQQHSLQHLIPTILAVLYGKF